MSEPISVGDLVMMVRGHECAMALIGGIPFRVLMVTPQEGGGWTCGRCFARDLAPNEAWGARLLVHASSNGSIPLGWLKRIPPLSELESEKRDEEITA